jgi:hypothetical protein
VSPPARRTTRLRITSLCSWQKLKGHLYNSYDAVVKVEVQCFVMAPERSRNFIYLSVYLFRTTQSHDRWETEQRSHTAVDLWAVFRRQLAGLCVRKLTTDTKWPLECRLLGYKNLVRTSQETHYVSATEPSQLMLCKIWGFLGGDNEECLLGYKNPVRTSQETHYISATEPSRLMLCKIWCFHGSDYEECRLLEY